MVSPRGAALQGGDRARRRGVTTTAPRWPPPFARTAAR